MFRRNVPDIMRKRGRDLERPSSLFDLMESFWREPSDFLPFREAEFPSIDMSEDDKEITVRAELPGMESKDVDISLQNNNLILQGEKKFEDEEKRGDYHRIERSYGSFYRAIPIPREVDENNIKAKYKNGVLEIKLPKTETSKSKKIEIES